MLSELLPKWSYSVDACKSNAVRYKALTDEYEEAKKEGNIQL